MDTSTKLLAQAPVRWEIGRIGGEGLGPFGNRDWSGEAPVIAIATVISTVIGFITIVAGLFFMFQFIIGGLGWISSSGEKQALETARNRISNALVGLLIVVAAYGITAILGAVLGIDILLEAPATLVNQLMLQ